MILQTQIDLICENSILILNVWMLYAFVLQNVGQKAVLASDKKLEIRKALYVGTVELYSGLSYFYFVYFFFFLIHF